jgi:Zn-finger protein
MKKQKFIDDLIDKNRLANRREENPDSCPCYNGNRCHNGLDDYHLICLLCVCPEYNRSIDEGGCNINSQHGKWFYNSNLSKGKIWDCSDCKIPHTEKFVRNYLEKLSLEELKDIEECETVNDLWKFFDKM